MKIFEFNNWNKNIPPAVNFLIKLSFFLAALASILCITYLGIAKVSQFCLPLVLMIGKAFIVAFLFVLCPLSFVKEFRPWLVIPTYILSYALAGCAWLYSLLFVIGNLGFWGILFCFLFQTLTPITLMGAVFKGSWDVVGTLTLWLIFTYVIRIYSWILTLGIFWKEDQRKRDRIIDIEATSKDE